MNTTIQALQALYVKLGGSLTDTYATIADGAQVGNYTTIPDMIQACTQKAGSGGGGSLPDMTGHSGKFLTNNGTAASWGDVPSDAVITTIAESVSTIPSGTLVAAANNGKIVYAKIEFDEDIYLLLIGTDHELVNDEHVYTADFGYLSMTGMLYKIRVVGTEATPIPVIEGLPQISPADIGKVVGVQDDGEGGAYTLVYPASLSNAPIRLSGELGEDAQQNPTVTIMDSLTLAEIYNAIFVDKRIVVLDIDMGEGVTLCANCVNGVYIAASGDNPAYYNITFAVTTTYDDGHGNISVKYDSVMFDNSKTAVVIDKTLSAS